MYQANWVRSCKYCSVQYLQLSTNIESNYILGCWSEFWYSRLTSTKSCSKEKWCKKVLWKPSLCLGQSSKYLKFQERYGLLWSHLCTLAVAGKAVSTAEALTYCGHESWDLVQQPEHQSWGDGCMKGWATAWHVTGVLCNPDLSHSGMNTGRSQHCADCSSLLKWLILVFSTIYLETYANLKFT